MRILIEAGADINARAADGCSPLHIASLHGSTECMKILLDAGCDINIRSSLGALPYEVALYSGHPHAAVIIEQFEDTNQKCIENLEYFNFKLPVCLRGRQDIKLKQQSKIYEFEDEEYDEVDEYEDFSEYVIEGKILEEDVMEGSDNVQTPEVSFTKSDGARALEAITSYLLTPLETITTNVLGGLSRSPSYELQSSTNTPRNNIKFERPLKSTAEETKTEISLSSANTSSLEYFTNPVESVESSAEITEHLEALSDNPNRAQVLANKFIEETLAALSDNPENAEFKCKQSTNGVASKSFSPERNEKKSGQVYSTPTRLTTNKTHNSPSPKKTKKLENERLGFTWLTNLNKYKSYSMSMEESLFEKETKEIVSNVVESIELMNMDLDRCCFREFTKSKRKLLLGVAAKILITGEVSSILGNGETYEQTGKLIRYRQGMLSLLAPIVEAFFETSDGYGEIDNSNDSDQNELNLNPVEKTLMMKVLETFHSILEVFKPLNHYYCHESITSTSSPFEQVFDIALHILRYWAPEIYGCLIWRGMDLTFFAIPWISTLMADALPLRNVLHLWSKLFEAILVGKSSDNMERHISFISSISSNSNNFNSSGILGSLITSVLLQLSRQISPVSTYDEGEEATRADRLPFTEELLLLFSSVNNADESLERFAIFDEIMICDGIEYLLTNTPKVILNGKSYKNTEDAFLHRHWGNKNDDYGAIWTNLRAVPVFYIHEIDLKSTYPCLIIQMDDNITNTLSDDLLRFLGPKSPKAHSSEPDSITASMIVDKLKGHLKKNGIGNINECKFRELRMKGMLCFFRNWALALSEDLGSHNILKSRSSEFGEVKGTSRIKMKTKVSKGWSGVLNYPPQRHPKVPLTLGRSLTSLGINSNNVKPVVVIVEYDKDILNDDRKQLSDNIIDAQDVAAVLTTCNVSSIIVRSI